MNIIQEENIWDLIGIFVKREISFYSTESINAVNEKSFFFGHSYRYEGSEHCITNVKFE